jgi:ribosome assembly protein 3
LPKNGRIPSPLRDLHDSRAAAKFEEYYMKQLTSEFGDDLDKVRGTKDFSDRSLPMLVRALRMGVNIFDEAEKRVVIREGTTTTTTAAGDD